MALEICWTSRAEQGLQNVIDYLEVHWTTKEIIELEQKIYQVLNLITTFPNLFKKSEFYPQVNKAVIDKNNYLVYRINKKTKTIEIINFRGTKQLPIY